MAELTRSSSRQHRTLLESSDMSLSRSNSCQSHLVWDIKLVDFYDLTFEGQTLPEVVEEARTLRSLVWSSLSVMFHHILAGRAGEILGVREGFGSVPKPANEPRRAGLLRPRILLTQFLLAMMVPEGADEPRAIPLALNGRNNMDRSWIYEADRLKSVMYSDGVQDFMSVARSYADSRGLIRCPLFATRAGRGQDLNRKVKAVVRTQQLFRNKPTYRRALRRDEEQSPINVDRRHEEGFRYGLEIGTHKNRMFQHYLVFNSKEEALEHPYPNMNKEEWTCVCDLFVSEEFQRRSAINKENRAKLKIVHTSGARSFQRARALLVRKNGGVTESKGKSYTEVEIFAEVLGTKAGYVRGLGRSVLSVGSSSSVSSVDLSRRLEEARLEIEEMRARQLEYEALLSNSQIWSRRCESSKCR
ncbi:hypothetical protein CJ030_MR0G005320 [Morella rubra]|uniref:Uncharacterized protein n=1 Tax=Morella rubra TaxID=262757 RepID=A0A6A1ULE1_9ROSI|nr:hypothetical protein CJ030_MR0G005320 [Morella rubra]